MKLGILLVVCPDLTRVPSLLNALTPAHLPVPWPLWVALKRWIRTLLNVPGMKLTTLLKDIVIPLERLCTPITIRPPLTLCGLNLTCTGMFPSLYLPNPKLGEPLSLLKRMWTLVVPKLPRNILRCLMTLGPPPYGLIGTKIIRPVVIPGGKINFRLLLRITTSVLTKCAEMF